MTLMNPLEKTRIQRPARLRLASWVGPAAIFALGAAVALAALLRYGPGLRGDLVLPGLSGLFLVLAAAIALIAWRRPRKSLRPTYWDVAGAFTLIAIMLAAAVEPEQMVRLVAGEGTSP